MSQYEQENHLGRGGGEVDEETLKKGWEDAAERRGATDVEEERESAKTTDEPQPWAKLSSGDAD